MIPTRFDPIRLAILATLMKAGFSAREIGDNIGMSRSTLYEWINEIERFKAEAIELGVEPTPSSVMTCLHGARASHKRLKVETGKSDWATELSQWRKSKKQAPEPTVPLERSEDD